MYIPHCCTECAIAYNAKFFGGGQKKCKNAKCGLEVNTKNGRIDDGDFCFYASVLLLLHMHILTG
jgi:hypothetical protein